MTNNAPICVTIDCERDASYNDYFPNSEGGQYWTLCSKCYKKNNGDIDTDDDYIETLKSKVERLDDDNTKLNKSLKKKTKLIKKLRKTFAKKEHSNMLKELTTNFEIECLKETVKWYKNKYD